MNSTIQQITAAAVTVALTLTICYLVIVGTIPPDVLIAAFSALTGGAGGFALAKRSG